MAVPISLLISELEKLDARAANLIKSKAETVAKARETRCAIEDEHRKFKQLALSEELRRLGETAAE